MIHGVKGRALVLKLCAVAALRRKKLETVGTHCALFFATLARRNNSKRQFEA
jgi:hypothetical protein